MTAEGWSAHTNTNSPTSQPGMVGRSRNPNLGTHRHASHPSQDWRGNNLARTQTHTPQHPSQDWSKGPTNTTHPGHHLRGKAKTCARTHARQDQEWRATRGARAQLHTPQHLSQYWRGAGKMQAQTHTPQTPASIVGEKPKPVPKHTHPRPQQGLVVLAQNPDANRSATQQ